METVIIWLGVAGLILALVWVLKKSHNLMFRHYVIIKRSENNERFEIVEKGIHEVDWLPDKFAKEIKYGEVVNMIKTHRAVFFTYSESKDKYAKVILHEAGYLYTEFDSAKDNNINELPRI